MNVPDWIRLALYIVAAILPTWSEYFTTSTDYTFRGLTIPVLASINSAVIVLLARTRSPRLDAAP